MSTYQDTRVTPNVLPFTLSPEAIPNIALRLTEDGRSKRMMPHVADTRSTSDYVNRQELHHTPGKLTARKVGFRCPRKACGDPSGGKKSRLHSLPVRTKLQSTHIHRANGDPKAMRKRTGKHELFKYLEGDL